LHLALVHETRLGSKKSIPLMIRKKIITMYAIGGVEIAAHFAGEQGPEFTHRSALLPSDLIRMGQLDENILERSPALEWSSAARAQ